MYNMLSIQESSKSEISLAFFVFSVETIPENMFGVKLHEKDPSTSR